MISELIVPGTSILASHSFFAPGLLNFLQILIISGSKIVRISHQICVNVADHQVPLAKNKVSPYRQAELLSIVIHVFIFRS